MQIKSSAHGPRDWEITPLSPWKLPDIHISQDVFECKNAAVDLYGEKFKPTTELNEMLRVSHTDETLPLSEPNYQHLGFKKKRGRYKVGPISSDISRVLYNPLIGVVTPVTHLYII